MFAARINEPAGKNESAKQQQHQARNRALLPTMGDDRVGLFRRKSPNHFQIISSLKSIKSFARFVISRCALWDCFQSLLQSEQAAVASKSRPPWWLRISTSASAADTGSDRQALKASA